MKKVEMGNNVTVHYVGTLHDGTEFDNSKTRGAPFDFQIGAPGIIPGFSDGIIGMSEGEIKQINIRSDQAYGNINEDALQTISKESFPANFDFTVGTLVTSTTPQGQQVGAKIKEIQTYRRTKYGHYQLVIKYK